MNHVDALTAPAADILANDFMEILFPEATPAAPRALRVVGRSSPFEFLLKLGPHGLCNKYSLF
jgi:hypothetical protein